ncbi:MAG: hypothetical protein AW08_01022 [Candidatus Accumulibacter adjunctus]|uniref:Uncharacterized protein n=1 Tax=Candidatus Accumulibacter adjunctus TaxID=1454001 RepID=A0A011NVR1_9PROT|nr:MAG: hypothetical protein AW08_01022 [Candidatus Accumulibacter adjunctus]
MLGVRVLGAGVSGCGVVLPGRTFGKGMICVSCVPERGELAGVDRPLEPKVENSECGRGCVDCLRLAVLPVSRQTDRVSARRSMKPSDSSSTSAFSVSWTLPVFSHRSATVALPSTRMRTMRTLRWTTRVRCAMASSPAAVLAKTKVGSSCSEAILSAGSSGQLPGSFAIPHVRFPPVAIIVETACGRAVNRCFRPFRPRITVPGAGALATGFAILHSLPEVARSRGRPVVRKMSP